MNAETRIIRPFVGLRDLEGCLEEVVLHFGRDVIEANGSITVDLTPHDFLLRRVWLEWSAEEKFRSFKKQLISAAEEAGIDPDSLALVVIGTSAFLRVAEVLLSHSLSELASLEPRVELSHLPKWSSLKTPFSGFSIEVYLLLRKHLPKRPLKPHRKGTWLARSRYRVDTTYVPALLALTPLDDEVRSEYQLLPKTLKFIDFGDHNVTEPANEQDPPTVYLDEKLLSQLSARRSSPVGRIIQAQLAHEFISGVIWHAVHQADVAEMTMDDLRGSLFGNVVRQIAGSGASEQSLDSMIRWIVSEPHRAIARAEHSMGLLDIYNKSLESEGS